MKKSCRALEFFSFYCDLKFHLCLKFIFDFPDLIKADLF